MGSETEEQDFFTAGSAGGKPARAEATKMQPVEREAPSGVKALGRGSISFNKALFKYDVVVARKSGQGFAVTKEDRMSTEEARDALDRIHKLFGIDKIEESKLWAFDRALLFSHAINGGSVLQPGRAKISVDNSSFDVSEVDRILGIDKRRFYRAFADVTVEVNKEVLSLYDPYNPVICEMVGWLQQAASDRGLQKYPYLAHDTADSATKLSAHERIALAVSKERAIPSVNNADRAFHTDRVVPSSGFSTVTGPPTFNT